MPPPPQDDVKDTEVGVKSGSGDDEGHASDNTSVIDAQQYSYTEDRKIGVTGAVFLILNKMIGTGSTYTSFSSNGDIYGGQTTVS